MPARICANCGSAAMSAGLILLELALETLFPADDFSAQRMRSTAAALQ
jgi:hypothetical protein